MWHHGICGHDTIAMFAYNLEWCVELKGEDLWSYSHKIESVSLWKYPYDH